MSSKILIYSDCFTYSGSENVIENILCSDIINKEFDVEFCFAYNKDYTRRFWQRMDRKISPSLVSPLRILSRGYFVNNFRQKKNPQLKRIYFLLLALGISFLEWIFIAHIYNTLVLYLHFKKKRVNLLYINNGGYPGAISCRIAVIAGKLANVGSIVFNVNNMAYPANGAFDRALDRFLAKHVTYFITASFAAQKQMIKIRNFECIKFKRIPNTLLEDKIVTDSESLLLSSDGRFCIGSVGLLTFRKGYHVLIDAVKMLLDLGHVDFKIYIIGEGEERENLQNQIMRNDLYNYVELLGFKSDPLTYLKHFDIFVLSSVSNEDFPYVILEAMYFSKPIIGTNVAGIPEQVENGRNGYVVKPNSASDLAEKLALMMSKREDLNRMGNESKQIYSLNFSYNQVLNSYFELFKSLINK